jgi:phosphotransacetylase
MGTFCEFQNESYQGVAIMQEKQRIQSLFSRAPRDVSFNMGVVCPEDPETLKGVLLAAHQKIITPVLIGRLEKIQQAAKVLGESISAYHCVAVASEEEAAMVAVKMAKEGKLNALMKGSLHTDLLMSKIVAGDGGLRTERRMSHAMVADLASYHKLLIISDVALNIRPTLAIKKDIVQNAIDFARSLGIDKPKVALLSSVEIPSDKVPSSMDGAELCHMVKRGEITGGVVAGPMQFDAAISLDVARTKKMAPDVAGDPDIMIVPDLDSGNILIKALEHCAGAACYGVILGAKVPVIVLSRAATADSRVGSCILAKFIADSRNLKF